MVTVDDLAVFLGWSAPPADQTEALQRVLDAAAAAITPHLIDTVNPLPAGQQQALDTAQLKAAGELWRWQQSTGGGQYVYADGQDYPNPVYRDVYHGVQPLLMHAGLVARGMA
jgi:hypothetical protein